MQPSRTKIDAAPMSGDCPHFRGKTLQTASSFTLSFSWRGALSRGPVQKSGPKAALDLRRQHLEHETDSHAMMPPRSSCQCAKVRLHQRAVIKHETLSYMFDLCERTKPASHACKSSLGLVSSLPMTGFSPVKGLDFGISLL